MKRFIRFFAVAFALALCLTMPLGVFAATVEDATIDSGKTASLTIWKYDWTNALKDGAWDADSFISTGYRESYVENILGGTGQNTLGNGESSNGYAVKGVQFTYLKVGEIVTFSESIQDGHVTQVLFGIHKATGAGLLDAIGLGGGALRYTNADNTDKLDSEHYFYYTSDTLNRALAGALASNATTVKNALEGYVQANGGTAMPVTDENGKSMVRSLPLGLYILVETMVPETVVSTTNPFFISLPMTTVSGNGNSAGPEGGHRWNYDVAVYPKNETGIPTLEKTVREARKDTGKNNGSGSITDGFAHNATASAGDTVEFQVISTLPTITSAATHLKTYSFYDSITPGLRYNKDVKLEFFTDKGCTDKAASWDMDSGKFDVSYSPEDRHMTVTLSALGLAEVNGGTENIGGKLYAGYSNYTARLTYSCDVVSSQNTTLGEDGNANQVVLTWQRSNANFYDTLVDDAHVYTFGLDLTKYFKGQQGSILDNAAAEAAGMYQHVKFMVRNATDGYYLTATRNEEEGIYYVTGHVAEEADATVFYPVDSGEASGKLIIKGLEDDEYILTEVETYTGYLLLKDDIHVILSAAADTSRPCGIYSTDTKGLLQNDPYYSFDGGLDLSLNNIPQKQLVHSYFTASATVDGNAVTMLEDKGSANALVPLSAINPWGFELPPTGGIWAMVLPIGGVVGMAAVGLVVFLLLVPRKGKKKDGK